MSESHLDNANSLGSESSSNQAALDLATKLLEEAQAPKLWWYEAVPSYRRALDIREQILGPNHLLVADTIELFARVLDDIVYYTALVPPTEKEALKEEMRALENRARAIRAIPRQE